MIGSCSLVAYILWNFDDAIHPRRAQRESLDVTPSLNNMDTQLRRLTALLQNNYHRGRKVLSDMETIRRENSDVCVGAWKWRPV